MKIYIKYVRHRAKSKEAKTAETKTKMTRKIPEKTKIRHILQIKSNSVQMN